MGACSSKGDDSTSHRPAASGPRPPENVHAGVKAPSPPPPPRTAEEAFPTANTFTSTARDTFTAADPFAPQRPKTMVKAFGRNVEGQLGLGSPTGTAPVVSEVSTPTAIESLNGIPVANIVCGSFHTMLLDMNNVLYGFGEGRDGQLGHGQRKSVQFPAVVSFFRGRNPKHVACGEQHTLVACCDGLFAFGKGGEGQLGVGDDYDRLVPTPVPCFPSLEKIEIVACGSHHSMVYYDGSLFAFGWNGCGQLMLGDDNTRFSPQVIPFFDSRSVGNVIAVACGVRHSCVLCHGGLYVAGGNEAGQLGLGDQVGRSVPTKVTFFDDMLVKGVSAWYHTLAWTEGDGIFAFGEGTEGKLGRSANLQLVPAPIPAFNDKAVLRAIAGSEHSAVFCVDGLYMWGNGSGGKLGHGSRTSILDPAASRVTALIGHRIIDVDLGVDHTIVAVEKMG